jgi:deoxyribonuclease IV
VLLGAHVSTAGGVTNAPARGAEIGATAIQIFTKQPNRWAEKPVGEEEARLFREGILAEGIGFTCSHDSYLIEQASIRPPAAFGAVDRKSIQSATF